MPLIIFKYLSKQVLQILFAVSLVVLLILMSGRFISYLSQAAEGALKAEFVIAIVAYRVPEFLVMILPLGLFLGIILSYGRLYVDNEMSVLSACGVSQHQLLKITMIPAVGVMAVVALLSLYIAPAGIQRVESILATQNVLTEFDTMVPGRFQMLGDRSRATYAENLSKDRKTMEEVFIVNENKANPEEGRMTLIIAKTANMTKKENGVRYLLLNDGYRYDLTPGQLQARAIEYKRYGLQMPEHARPAEVSLEQAFTTRQLLNSNAPGQIAELQWRISLPLLIPILVLIAIPFAKVNPRQGRFAKLLPALLLYLFYIMSLLTVRGSVADNSASPVWAMWSVHVVYFCLAVVIYFYEPVRLMLAKRSVRGA